MAETMRRSRLLWQLAVPLAVLITVGLVAVSWQASRLMRSSHSAQIASELASASALLDEAVGGLIAGADRAAIDPVAKRIGQQAKVRVTVIAPDGTVLGESDNDPALMDNHARRPEIAAALQSGIGEAVRHSDTINTEMMYSARAVRRDGRTLGVVRVGVPLEALEAADRRLRVRSAMAAALVALVMLSFGFFFVRRLTRPLEELEALADEYAHGRLDRPLPAGGSVEIERVASAMQKMARELDGRIATLVAERNEQKAVLSSMIESVLAIDRSERVMALNDAAAKLLDVDARQAIGRTIQEVARNVPLQKFVAEALAADAVLERDIALHGDEPRHLQAHGAPVLDAAGRRIGAVIVLNDVTRLRRLETVRRDFVANVSHELKTPVTSIKGFLETLLGGALEEPENARRFVEIASRQADRLGAIIEDLLVLSRIDQETGQPGIEKSPTLLASVIDGAVDVCRNKADQKKIRLDATCTAGLSAPVNAALVEQAVVNLIDNAIKYSDAGDVVEIRGSSSGGSVSITVRDHGPGIDAEHLPRLFERFYRVDKARSRSLGGTGLGLAIVKHIVQTQGGTVDVESTPGHGSTFSLRFPAV